MNKSRIEMLKTMVSKGYKITKEGKILHREIYKKAFGPIPPGWVVHHVDGVKSNNNPNNLVAMPRRIHTRLHSQCHKNGQPLPTKKDTIRYRDSFVLLEFSKQIDRLEQQIKLAKIKKEEYRQRSMDQLALVPDSSVYTDENDLMILEPPFEPINRSASSYYR